MKKNFKGMVFLDLDGTVAKFYERQDTCLEDMYRKNFFLHLSPYTVMVMAVRKLIEDGVRVIPLSAYPCESAKNEKIQWIKLFFPDLKDILLCPVGQNKASVARDFLGISENSQLPEGTILVDDYTKNLNDWRAASGIGVKFINEINGKNGTHYRHVISYDSSSDEIVKVIEDILSTENSDN